MPTGENFMSERISISRGHHPGGAPVIDGATIRLGDIRITLTEADYQALCAQIESQLGEQRKELHEFYQQSWERHARCDGMLRDIRDIFFEEFGEDRLMLRDEDEIDHDRLREVLMRYPSAMGLK
jgi:hypothetical protein